MTKFIHKKTGGEYTLLYTGRMQTRNWVTISTPPESVDMEEVIIYYSLKDDSIWVRPLEDFKDRFEEA